jgi:WD40 repeat protein
MVVWDAVSFAPVKTYLLPHEGGVEAIDISDDALYIATLGCPTSGYASDQELAIWAWTLPSNDAILRSSVNTDDYQYSVRFDLSDNTQVVTTGEKSIQFWRWDDFNLASYSGRVSKTDLGNFGGDFVTTIFLPATENALTATTEGYVIVWESNADEEKEKMMGHAMKEATKVLKLVDCGINIMTTTRNDYLAIACADGAVRFYDYFLRLEAWFEDLNAGPITSISFSVQECPFAYGEAGAPGLKFWVPDFVAGTSDGFVVGVESSVFDEVRKEDRRGTLLMQGMSEEVTAVACHPTQALVVMACANGVLQIWNYDMKLLMILREFNSNAPATAKGEGRLAQTKVRSYLRPSCAAFDPSGKVLAVGFSSGLIKLLFTENLEDGNSYAPSSEAIHCVKFSASGKFLAAYDSSRHVLLFKRYHNSLLSKGTHAQLLCPFLNREEPAPEVEERAGSPFPFGRNSNKPSSPLRIGSAAPAPLHDASFVYIGRARSHTAPISGIAFGMKDAVETLISISEDQ